MAVGVAPQSTQSIRASFDDLSLTYLHIFPNALLYLWIPALFAKNRFSGLSTVFCFLLLCGNLIQGECQKQVRSTDESSSVRLTIDRQLEFQDATWHSGRHRKLMASDDSPPNDSLKEALQRMEAAADKESARLENIAAEEIEADISKESVESLKEEIEAYNRLGKLIEAQWNKVDRTVAAANKHIADTALVNVDEEGHTKYKEESVSTPDPGDLNRTSEANQTMEEIAEIVDDSASLKQKVLEYTSELNAFFASDEGATGLFGKCGKPEKALPRLVDWQPEPGKYLVALCNTGQMSNRLLCMNIYLTYAALLNRTLIISMNDLSHRTHYDFEQLIDLDHASKCVEGGRIITVQEYFRLEKKDVLEVKMRCMSKYAGEAPGTCNSWEKWSVVVGAFPFRISGSIDRTDTPPNPTVEDFVADYGRLTEPVLSCGEVQHKDFTNMPFLRREPNGIVKLKDKHCQLILQAHPAIWETAEKITHSLLGSDYVGVHLRRGDFVDFCRHFRGDKKCFQPIIDVGTCLAERLNSLGRFFTAVYVSTNAEKHELHILKETILAKTDHKFVFLGLPSLLESELLTPLKAKQWEEVQEVHAALEKLIVAKSAVFFGSPRSSFTEEINRIRKGLGKATCLDGFICGE